MTQRRNFIKSIGLLAAGSAVVPGALAQKSQDTDCLQSDSTGSDEFTLNILQTTDVHCQLHPHDEMFWENGQKVFRKVGGYAYLSTFVKNERKKNPNTFLIDTGDMFQGSELSIETTGKAIVPILNEMRYDLYLPGNWEVVYYKPRMMELMGSLNAPKICANMFHDTGNQTKGEYVFPPYYIWHIHGVKIGFIGYTDHLVPLRQSPNYSKGIIYTKPEENIAYFVDVLKNQEKCAFVIVIAHIGLSQQIHLANLPETAGVDYIFGADTHERVRKPIQCKYAKVVEPGAFGSFIGKLELKIKDGKVIRDKYSFIEINPGQLKEDKKVSEIIREAEAPYKAEINAVAGYSRQPLYRYFVIENTIDTLILNAIRYKMGDSTDIILSNGFRFCPPNATPDHTGNIPITNGYIFDMLPIDSQVKTAKATGKQIITWLEKELNNVFAANAAERFGGWMIKFNGMEISFRAFGENGKRVEEIIIGNMPIDAEKMYSIAACERDGDPDDMICRMRNVKEPKLQYFTLHQCIKEYLAANSPVDLTISGKAKVLDASPDLLTQVSGVDYEFR